MSIYTDIVFLSREATQYPKYGKISQSIALTARPSDEGIMVIA